MHAFVLRIGPPVRDGKIMAAESASQPITVCHFTGSDVCHIIISLNHAKLPENIYNSTIHENDKKL